MVSETKPTSHSGIAPGLRPGPSGHPGSIPGVGGFLKCEDLQFLWMEELNYITKSPTYKEVINLKELRELLRAVDLY